MRITADTEVCVGAGMCALTLPDVFEQDEDEGTVVLRVHQPPPAWEASVRHVVGLCPSGALALLDD